MPKYFSSPKELTLYVKKMLGVKSWEKRRTYRVGAGVLKKVLEAKGVKVEIAYRVIEEIKSGKNGEKEHYVIAELNKYVSIVYAIICKEAGEHG